MEAGLKKVLLTAAMLIIFTVFSCRPPSGSMIGNSGDPEVVGRGLADEGSKKVPVWGYEYGSGVGLGDEYFLKTAYEEWKNNYVTSVGAGGNLRVKRDYGDGMHPNDTVSEGQAYGMLLAVYFDDKETFDQLFNYAEYHSDESLLMHWLVRATNEEISEFAI